MLMVSQAEYNLTETVK